jgi:hypothetical protein
MFKLNKPVTVLQHSLIEELAAGSFGRLPPVSHPIWTWAKKRADALVAEADAARTASHDVRERNEDLANTRQSDHAFYQMLDDRFGSS